ncbi:DegT/DnrJ/EryC1/StrS family aminotransferase, partial [Ferruginibacter sp.]|uniref:DegT/DnrJ/EryC1/StrS family aminotransferase n=1 Tax=Ferruginibacter sp. TaxID=1940288 RepID=UPI0019CA3783
DDYFANRFKERSFTYVADGRKAINIALQQYHLQPEDVVTIFTSSGNFYISGCVTKEIEKFCQWSREITDQTKLIFVNHEFGYPYKQIEKLQTYNLPIIEDCCHSFFSTDEGNEIGVTGDFAIYSFPKMFPLQMGGLLTANRPFSNTTKLNNEKLQYIKNVLSHYIVDEKSIIEKRIAHYNYLKNSLDKNLFQERFALSDGIAPGVFMFRVKDAGIYLPPLKEHLYAHGIQCSIFYGESSFFIPVHQNLRYTDFDYFVQVIASFIKS